MHTNQRVSYAIGLMSGTSLDGIDAAIVKMKDLNGNVSMELIHFDTISYEQEVKDEILKLCDPESSRVDNLSSMNMLLGILYADAALKVIKDVGLDPTDIDLISSHGQTIFHQPSAITIGKHLVASTLQIGDIGVIAEKTGITTVGDFRTRDIAAGGQGAPLVPYADYQLFQHESFGRVLVNIGGISNITILPKGCNENAVFAYDTGPGNMIIDFFVEKITDGKRSYDKNGDIARKGTVHQEWLSELLQHPYFAEHPPKSTGREMFGKEYASFLWGKAEELTIQHEDKVATVTELTAITLTNEIKQNIELASISEVLISGGGSKNKMLMERIDAHLPNNVVVKTTDDYGVNADAKEAMIFALLGYQCLQKRTNNLPAATGSKRNVVMGKIAW
ncbi:anhydro-N-acetylmuramic acid kinase [Oceanobacillus limi]|uniref:Anhydro-N-acetylmuramic acid kinase n=1 Tax=Oceanobacillus limi TaxID=930131 RepID=A0A1I0BIM1_9BACI|nr:anhydro-N-acetylmuramic acid kinase [Oceanobacillus limi]SET06736.1 anhydro-N-acetylmuramic acid kinase [Oceanobacillus limi]